MTCDITVTVNGVAHRHAVEPRLLLSDFLRHTLALTGTHVGCEHGVCGACTVLLDGDSVRACLMFAVQADGCRVETVESLGRIGELNALQEAFHAHHALQCGFCTPGMLMTATDLLKKYPLATDDEIREGLSGNLCRCTGYEHIVKAIRAVKDTHMKMHALSGGRLRMRKSVYIPAAGRDETIELPVLCFLLRHPQGNVLFDTGCHPAFAEDPAARWGGMAKFITPIMPPGDNVLERARRHRGHGRRHRCRGVLASASGSLRLQCVLQACDRHGAREGNCGRAWAGCRGRWAMWRPNGISARSTH